MKNLSYALAFVLISFSLSCKKEEGKDNPPASKACRLLSSLENDTAYTGYDYDASGRMINIKTKRPSVTDTFVAQHSFDGNRVYLYTNGQKIGTHYLNNMGWIDSTVVSINSGDMQWKVYFTYSTEGYKTKKQETFTMRGITGTFTSNSQTQYFYSNGNLVSTNTISDGSLSNYTYEYYTDKFNDFAANDENQNMEGKASKNLVKKITNTDLGYSTNYSYTFDTDGRVILESQTDKDNTTTVTKFTWGCR